MIKAEVILDSVSPQGHRLTTMLLRYPRYVHSEFMTHRMFSRNASSSRAVPVSKNLEEVRDPSLRAAPVSWGCEQKGMQPGGELEGEDREKAIRLWDQALRFSASVAEEMSALGVHKSIINRLIEPGLHINVLVSATEWDNFFGLRLDKAADPTMRALAEAMWEARSASTPTPLQPGQWHLPFVETGRYLNALAAGVAHGNLEEFESLKRVSVARCARLSYRSFETGRESTLEEDLALYDKLLGAQPLHASPAEHQATPDEIVHSMLSNSHRWAYPEQHGNFTGWRQYRKLLPNEAVAPLPVEYLS